METEAENARLDAGFRAQFTAARLRQILADPRLLEAFAAEQRFELDGTALRIPPEVGWLEEPRLPRRDDLDLISQHRLNQLRPGPEAQAILDRMRAEPQHSDELRDWLGAEAAWLAWRGGARERCAELLAPLARRQGGAAPGATLLLLQRLDGALPDWAPQRIRTLPVALAGPLLDRLAELGVETGPLRRALAQTLRHRETLRAVAGLAERLVGQTTAGPRLLDDQLILLFGSQGARTDAAGLRSALGGLAQRSWTNLPADTVERLRLSPDPAEVPVLPGVLGLSPALAERDGTRRFLPLALLVGLLLLSGSSLWLLLRSARREVALARTRAEFLTMVTHELKTPIAGIRLLAEMLEEGRAKGPDKRLEYYRRLGSEAVRLSMLIENVLDLGRMERGESALDLRPLDLNDLLGEARQLFGPMAQANGLRIEVTATEPCMVRGDRHALLQALLNLMDNARKYASAGGRLELSLRPGAETVDLRIRDWGPGIDDADRARIFGRFSRGEEQRSGSVPGVGLGLYLARTILQQHGGDLRLDPETTLGACFVLSLPPLERSAGLPQPAEAPA